MDSLGQEAYIFGSLFALANRVQLLGDQAYPELSTKQWLLIAMISKCENGAPTITEISRLIGSSHQNVRKMAAILEKRGFIQINRDEKDARALRVVLSEKCKEYFKGREQTELEFLKRLFADFSADQICAFYSGMQKMAENVSKMEREHEKRR